MRMLKNPTITVPIVVATNNTTGFTTRSSVNGYLQSALVTLPALDASATATLNVKDAAGNVLYTKSAIVASTTTLCTPTAPVAVVGTIKFEIVASAAQSTDKSITVAPMIDSFI